MECVADSEVLEAVQQRTDKVKIARMAKLEEIAAAAAAAAVVVEHARQRKKGQEEQARQRKEEQEEQAPKARGKYKTFDDRMEDLKQYKETHGHANVSFSEDKSLAQFCAQARHKCTNPGKSKGNNLTNEHIAAFDAIRFIWTTQETSQGRSTRGSKTSKSTSGRTVTST